MYKDQTYEVIKERILDGNISNIDKKEGSFTNNMISPIAVEFARTYMEFEHILNILFVTDSYGEYLDKKANEFGIYRKMGTKANGIVRVYGAEDTVIPRNATLTTNTGLVFIVSRQDYIKEEYVDLVIEASEIGEIYNIEADELWSTSISDGVNTIEVNKIKNTSKFVGGVEIESDDQLRERILEQARNPATSGNEQDYINWCKEIDGVFNVTVRPLWNGPNTVKLIISDEDKQPLPESIVTKCDEYIQSIRPIGANVTVSNPSIFHVDVSITVYTSMNSEDIKNQIKYVTVENLKYCTDKIRLNSLGAEYLSIEGMIDYDNFTINGSSNSVMNIPVDHVAVLRNLTVNFSDDYRR